MANGKKTAQGYEITIDVKRSRDGDANVRYVQNVNELLRTYLRRSGRFKDARFNSSRRKEGVIAVYGVPENEIKAALDRCNAQASKDHGYRFDYELTPCEADFEEIERNEIEEYESLLAELMEQNGVLKRRLAETSGKCAEFEGQLRLLRAERGEQVRVEKTTEKVEVYPLKAAMEVLRGYARQMDMLDSFFRAFEGHEISAETAIEIADLPFADFVREVYGEGLYLKVMEIDNYMFYNIEKNTTMSERQLLLKAPIAQLSAKNYKLFTMLSREAGAEMPCVLAPKDSGLAVYIPKGKASKGPASKALYSTVLDALKECGLKAESSKPLECAHVREMMFAPKGD
ncbi:MAG: hypothetical protein QXD77_02250, partial [Candidatus Aenigmatarchaeota archaeon]